MSKYSHIFSLCTVLALFPLWAGTAQPAPPRATVVLAHGILNRPFILVPLEKALEKEGFRVLNWGYASREKTVEQHAAELARYVQSNTQGEEVHFVGFSLGAIVIRYYLAHYTVPVLGRFVMIAPPNHGSQRVDRMRSWLWFQWLFGTKSIMQLRSQDTDFLEKIPNPPCPFGIVAGGLGNGKGWSRLLPGDDDGSVSVESTRLTGAADFLVLPYTHTALVLAIPTHRRVAQFLKTERFQE